MRKLILSICIFLLGASLWVLVGCNSERTSEDNDHYMKTVMNCASDDSSRVDFIDVNKYRSSGLDEAYGNFVRGISSQIYYLGLSSIDLNGRGRSGNLVFNFGDYSIEDARNSYRSAGFQLQEYESYEMWLVDDWAVAFMPDFVIIGPENEVESAIFTFKGKTKSLYQNDDFLDVIKELPEGIQLLVWKGGTLDHYDYEGLLVGGFSFWKTGDDTIRYTYVFKFSDSLSAANSIGELRREIIEDFNTSSVAVEQDGQLVIADALMDVNMFNKYNTVEDPSIETDISPSFEITEGSYSEIGKPKKPSILRWDFSGTNTYEYAYLLKTNSKIIVDSSWYTDEQIKAMNMASGTITSEGKFSVESQGDKTANVILNDNTESSGMFNDEKTHRDSTVTSSSGVVYKIKEDGSLVDQTNRTQDILVKLLFPLPNTALVVGQAETTYTMLPASSIEIPLDVSGTLTTTLKGYVEIDGQPCAHVSNVIELSDFHVPSEIRGEYVYVVRGQSESYFSLEEQRLIEGEMTFVIYMATETPISNVSYGEGGYLPEKKRTGTLMDYWVMVESSDMK